MKVATVLVVMVVAVLLVACAGEAPQEMPGEELENPPALDEPAVPDISDGELADLDKELSDVEGLDEELDFGDFDDLESDLDQI